MRRNKADAVFSTVHAISRTASTDAASTIYSGSKEAVLQDPDRICSRFSRRSYRAIPVSGWSRRQARNLPENHPFQAFATMFPRKPQPTIPNLIFIVKIPSLSDFVYIYFHFLLFVVPFLQKILFCRNSLFYRSSFFTGSFFSYGGAVSLLTGESFRTHCRTCRAFSEAENILRGSR